MSEFESSLLTMSAQQRADAMVKHILQQKEVWVLTDDDGCVMLTTDDEDGVPVWPTHKMAELWATDEWESCRPMAISLRDFHERWISGLTSDNLLVMLCPVPGEDGEVVSPEEFVQLLSKLAD